MLKDEDFIVKVRNTLSDLRESVEEMDELCHDRFDYSWMEDAIKEVPGFRIIKCCNREFKVDGLSIYFTCPICNEKRKLRCYSSDREIEDVIIAVLEWKQKRYVGEPEEVTPHFLCIDSSCDGQLELMAETETIDGGACGDGMRYEYYQCKECDKLHYRVDFDSWEEFSYPKHQENLQECKSIPTHREFCFLHPKLENIKSFVKA